MKKYGIIALKMMYILSLNSENAAYLDFVFKNSILTLYHWYNMLCVLLSDLSLWHYKWIYQHNKSVTPNTVVDIRQY